MTEHIPLLIASTPRRMPRGDEETAPELQHTRRGGRGRGEIHKGQGPVENIITHLKPRICRLHSQLAITTNEEHMGEQSCRSKWKPNTYSRRARGIVSLNFNTYALEHDQTLKMGDGWGGSFARITTFRHEMFTWILYHHYSTKWALQCLQVIHCTGMRVRAHCTELWGVHMTQSTACLSMGGLHGVNLHSTVLTKSRNIELQPAKGDVRGHKF